MQRNTLILATALLAAGCYGDVTASTGELGRLRYALHTDYESHQDELTALPLLTRYEHRLSVSLTTKGEKKAGDEMDDIVHSSPTASVQGEGHDLTVLAEDPGAAYVESHLDGELFDRIELSFDDPTHLDLLTWIREPWESDFQERFGAGALTVQEGTQISFLAVPMADDVRLGGEFAPLIQLDHPELAVLDAQVFAVQEGGLTLVGEPVTFYAIEPGTVTFSLSDPVHGVSVERTFEILPLQVDSTPPG